MSELLHGHLTFVGRTVRRGTVGLNPSREGNVCTAVTALLD